MPSSIFIVAWGLSCGKTTGLSGSWAWDRTRVCKTLPTQSYTQYVYKGTDRLLKRILQLLSSEFSIYKSLTQLFLYSNNPTKRRVSHQSTNLLSLPVACKLCALLTVSGVSSSLLPHGLQPARLPCPGDSPGQNPGVGCHAPLQGILPTQGSNPGLLHCRQILCHWATWEAPQGEKLRQKSNWGSSSDVYVILALVYHHLFCWFCSSGDLDRVSPHNSFSTSGLPSPRSPPF